MVIFADHPGFCYSPEGETKTFCGSKEGSAPYRLRRKSGKRDDNIILMGTGRESCFQDHRKTISVFFELTVDLSTSEAALKQNSPAFVLNSFCT